MCNICGSTSLEKAHRLYTEGLERGSFASGFLVFTKNHFHLLKQEKPFELKYLQKTIKDSLDEFGIYYSLPGILTNFFFSSLSVSP